MRASLRRFRLNPTARLKTHYQVFDDHLTLTSELVHSEFRWQAFLKIKEMKGYLCLIQDPAAALIIPLAYLSPNQAEQLQELVRNRVQSPPTKGR